jgi:hypothetical protein
MIFMVIYATCISSKLILYICIEILNVTKLRSMLGDKENKQSLQGQLSTNWHKKEVSTLMDHFFLMTCLSSF